MNRVLMEAEAAALERGAAILARSVLACQRSPAVSELEKAIEILLRNEAARTRYKLRGGKSLAHLFPDVGVAA